MSAVAAGFLFVLAMSLLYPPEPLGRPRPGTGPRRVTLLIWAHPFNRYHALPDCEALYGIRACTLTDDSGAYAHADAVIVHHREVAGDSGRLPPEPRPQAQKWIWMNFESPTHTRGLWRLEGVFNLTMTYRADSDIFLPYGYLIPLPPGAPGPRYGRALRGPSRSRPRPRLAAWVISNWSESHARVAFYYQLSRYVQVDVFGLAGRPVPEDSGSGSLVRLVRRYQFYLALENSQHTDYITEKLWNAILAGAVPVVLGPTRENYERFLPPEAFIHVDDFPTVRALARYLLLLRRNPDRLQHHLDWRRSYSVHLPHFWGEHYCTACRAVRNAKDRTDVVTDLAGWFQS
ncbi:alpha-(1,3)-fucosyltransferase 4-like [Lampris incognitus]|uniref:alpha-(1,3)-fucosyltransferase 4-like n=1 Tax=Lampris incognitus TaxID=2546036 RepID=UPI0024B5564C|nr:alpha-(1,3)-fucosyltransferase 4-like [Lampris incognitus]